MMKKILPSILITKKTEGDTVINAAGTYFSVSNETALLVYFMISNENISAQDLADKLSSFLDYSITAEDVRDAIEQLPSAFFNEAPNKNKFTLSISILKGKALNNLARVFSIFFTLPMIFFVTALTLSIFLYVKPFGSVVYGSSLLTPLLVFLSILFHEIGHAAACYAMGAKPGRIGFGINGVFPTFFTDVSDIWTRGRKERMIVDAGGVYFQIIFSAFLTLFIPLDSTIAASVKLIIVLAAFSCLPYFKFDGYWLLGDFLGKDSLETWIGNNVRQLYSKLTKGSFSAIDLKLLLWLSVYYLGFLCLQIWLLFAVVNLADINSDDLIFPNLKNWHQVFNWFASLGTLSSIFVLLIVYLFLIGTIKILNFVIGNYFSELIKDVCILFSAFFTLIIVYVFFPLHVIFPSIKNNIYKIHSALKKIHPPIPSSYRVAIRSEITRYKKIIWYLVLSKVSVRTGLWIIQKTHRVNSSVNFKSIREISAPVVLAAPHFGSFLSGAMLLLSEIGTSKKINIFYADPKTDPDNERYEFFYRRYFPDVSVLLNNKRGIVLAVKALRNNEVLIIMPDVFYGKDLVQIQLMNRTVGVMTGIAYFHRKFQAKVFPILSSFSGLCGVNIHIESELCFNKSSDDYQSDYVQIMSDIFIYFEKWFLAKPHEWHCWEKFINFSFPNSN